MRPSGERACYMTPDLRHEREAAGETVRTALHSYHVTIQSQMNEANPRKTHTKITCMDDTLAAVHGRRPEQLQ